MAPKRASSNTAGGGRAAKKLKLAAPGSLANMPLPEGLEGKLDFKPALATADNRPWNLKIVSWNVNGIRAALKSGNLGYLRFEDADIVCLQETKCHDADLPVEAKFSGCHGYYSAAEKKGYSSTALYSKVKPLHVQYGIGKPQHDNEGRTITAEFTGFYLVNVYVPNSGRGLVRLAYRRTWNTDFAEYCVALDAKKPVIITGDLNVAHTAIDLANPKTNVKNAGFTPQEREDMSTLLDSGFVDSFRHFQPEATGAYTFWTYMSNARARNVGWRLDYFLVSRRYMGNVAGSMMRSVVKGSDHCPIMLLLAEGPAEEVSPAETGSGTTTTTTVSGSGTTTTTIVSETVEEISGKRPTEEEDKSENEAKGGDEKRNVDKIDASKTNGSGCEKKEHVVEEADAIPEVGA